MKKAKLLCIILSLLLLTSTFSVFADEVPDAAISIGTTQEFLQFAENCRLDSYSQNLTVTLTADIDLTDQSFSGIPVFCGTFDGAGHTITGLTLNYSGSNAGLFRYLTATSKVSNLKVSATICPKGSASNVGGIAGSNAGTIQNCTFSGTVAGIDCIGGIAGINTQTGLIENCVTDGSIYADHFAGGIAGNNSGMIRDCQNNSLVNTVLQQNEVELSDITLEAITGSESVGTVTDIGGIAGISSGYISGCKNNAAIGYPHIGYNIGGIAGSQTGYISDCVNYGSIFGRKEVGGIVGQLEPVIAVTYSEDTLQILQQQLSTLSAQIDSTTQTLGNTVSDAKNQLVLIQGQLDTAIDAVEKLISQNEGSQPSPEDFSQVIHTLENTVSSIRNSLGNIYDSFNSLDTTLSRNLNRISGTISDMQQTLNHASENLGGFISDHSDADTESDLTAKIERCQNTGTVQADMNGGGIAGAIAFESDLDPEADIEIYGNSSLNFAGAYRAVITDCDNFSEISAKKQYAGGIVGYATLGMVRSCSNAANILCPDAIYVGGIAGKANGTIRTCYAKNRITAEKCAGGIAGEAKVVTDCLTISTVSAGEKVGAILGYADNLSALSGNRYLAFSPDLGAIDGISYEAIAEPASMDAFFLLENIPDFFKTYTVTFVFQDQSTKEITLETGKTIAQEQIPPLPDWNGCKGSWVGLDGITCFDTTIFSRYESKAQIVSSEPLRESGLPILLAEGDFQPDFSLEITKVQDALAPNAVEGWSFTNQGVDKLRFLPPEACKTSSLCVMIKDADGSWKQIPHTVNGSYLVFDVDSTSDLFCVVTVQNIPWGLYITAGALFLAISGISAYMIIRRKKAAKQAEKATTPN